MADPLRRPGSATRTGTQPLPTQVKFNQTYETA